MHLKSKYEKNLIMKTYLIITIEFPYLECWVGDGGDNTVGLGLQVVHDEVWGAAQGNFPYWPGSIVGQDGGQQTDPEGVL